MSGERSFTILELAQRVGGVAQGDVSLVVRGLNRIEDAGEGDLTFVASDQYAKFLPESEASCVLVRSAHASDVKAPSSIVVDDPYRAFILVMQAFHPEQPMPQGVRAPTATIDPSAEIDPTASIGPGCVIGAQCRVAKNVQLVANVVLYPNTHIGADSVLHANVTCYSSTIIGERFIAHAGVVIGSDGFGFLENADKSFVKIPHIGRVRIGDDVEIGANTTIDRAAVGETRIEDGVKLDNLIHIAHGVTIGAHTAIAAQTGISGSTSLGKRNRLAGQVGVVGHIQITDDVVIYAQSGVGKSVPQPGVYFGSPIKEHLTALRIEAAVRQLPTALQELRDLKRKVNEQDNS
ncbi:MAG: UDP-3-O-(3-hydroxymyristoyl)glucosamine N-acyltransferase [Candidatus Kapabacteria bacterium]|nr:UDP-3-O-(3-hydroxymyristoyl)glucosamine N-acyltransferase [Candidatus Kapabacteria bacterium]